MRSVYFCVYLVVFISFCNAQAQTEEPESASESNAAIQSVVVEPTDVICTTCACDGGVVDCAERDLQGFFTMGDWAGLKDTNVTMVNLSGNSFPSITMMTGLSISTLNLSNCQVERFQNRVFNNLGLLTTLDLSHNKIATSALTGRVFGRVPPQRPDQDFSTFENMRFLSLAYNDIHSLPADLFHFMPGLTSLDLSGNPFAFIDQVTQAAITSLQSLRELKMASCELDSLPDGLFRRQRRLEILDLSDNRFTTVPTVLSEATNLIYLNLNKNLMVNITEKTAISTLTKLQELRLCRLSKLTSISAGALGGLEKLVALRICYNPRLTDLDPGFLMWTDDHDIEQYPLLQTLHLQNNNISQVNPHFLDRWDQLTDVDFSNNPYSCDCNAQWMVDVLVPLISASSRNVTLNNMFCKRPPDVRGVTFAQLTASRKTLVCPETEKITDVPAPDSAILLGIMIGIFATFPIVLVIVLLWRKGYFAKCRRKVIKEKYHDEDEEGENEAF